MKKYLFLPILCFLSILATAQNTQKQPFKGVIGNAEYRIYIKMNLYENNVTVPGQEIFGELPGFMGDSIDSRKWLFTSAKTYTLKQVEGSNMKIARQRKWKKLPKTLVFIPKE